MKTIKIMTAMLTPLVIFAVAFALVGCEDEPNTGSLDANVDTSALGSQNDLPGGLRVVPDKPEITHIGQKVELEVYGGHWPYSWTTTTASRGTVKEEQNDSVGERFTAVYTAAEVAVNTIVVTDGHGRTGTAVVNASSASGPTLAITPSSTTFSTNTAGAVSFELKAVGGTPPYEWFNSATGGVSMVELSDDVVRMSRTLVAGQTFSVIISVTDSAEQTATSTFAQE